MKQNMIWFLHFIKIQVTEDAYMKHVLLTHYFKNWPHFIKYSSERNITPLKLLHLIILNSPMHAHPVVLSKFNFYPNQVGFPKKMVVFFFFFQLDLVGKSVFK